MHVAMRGAIPRDVIRQRRQVRPTSSSGGPRTNEPAYVAPPAGLGPGRRRATATPTTGVPLQTWDEALGRSWTADRTPEPAHRHAFRPPGGHQRDHRSLGRRRPDHQVSDEVPHHGVSETYSDPETTLIRPTTHTSTGSTPRFCTSLARRELCELDQVRHPAERCRARSGSWHVSLEGARPGEPRAGWSARPGLAGLVGQDPEGSTRLTALPSYEKCSPQLALDAPETDRRSRRRSWHDGRSRASCGRRCPSPSRLRRHRARHPCAGQQRWRAEYQTPAKESRDAAPSQPWDSSVRTTCGPTAIRPTTSPRAPDSRPNQVA